MGADPITMGLMIAGGLLGAAGNIDSGNAAMAEAQSQAAQLKYNAGQQRAAGQHAAEKEKKTTDLLLSKMLAISGASGGGVADPTMLNLFAQAEAEGKVASQTQLYNAEQSAMSMEAEAASALRIGAAKKRASRIQALGSLLGNQGVQQGAQTLSG